MNKEQKDKLHKFFLKKIVDLFLKEFDDCEKELNMNKALFYSTHQNYSKEAQKVDRLQKLCGYIIKVNHENTPNWYYIRSIYGFDCACRKLVEILTQKELLPQNGSFNCTWHFMGNEEEAPKELTFDVIKEFKNVSADINTPAN